MKIENLAMLQEVEKGGLKRELENDTFKPVHVCTKANSPEWLCRPFIESHYCVGGTPLQAFTATMFGFNNETLNAHTMLWLAAVSTYLYQVAREHLHADIFPFTLFWLSCVLHCPFSVLLHSTIGVSEQQRSVARSLDFAFIFSCSVLLALSLAYFIFTTPLLFGLFASCCFLMLGRTFHKTMVVRKMKDIPKKECAGYVAGMVLLYVLPMLAAAVRELYLQGRPGQLCALVSSAVGTIALGGYMYAHNLPERWFPGKLDLVCNSHQLMHVLAIGAHYLEWRVLCVLAVQHLHTY